MDSGSDQSGTTDADTVGADDSAGDEDTETTAQDCPVVGCRDSYSVATIPDVTLADLASFVPARPALTGEPLGFGVVGMPTNIVATASTHVLSGSLLGWSVDVRFTPVGFVFDYGDGTTAHTAVGGATWTSLGLPQFSPTDTSHVYRDRGTYTVGLGMQYSASVNFGTGWRPVAGFVTSDAPAYAIEVVEVRTALVDRTCAEAPTGPGC